MPRSFEEDESISSSLAPLRRARKESWAAPARYRHTLLPRSAAHRFGAAAAAAACRGASGVAAFLPAPPQSSERDGRLSTERLRGRWRREPRAAAAPRHFRRASGAQQGTR